MVRARTLLASLIVAGALMPGVASAASYTLGPDGKTAEAHSYASAVRERVYIPQPGIDQDANGVADNIAIEIIRPDGSGPSLKVPAIIDPSPYYTTICRGNESQCIADTDADGVNDKWPMFLDNYFVPRGYAVILAESNGTANSTGCPLHGGPGDIAGMKSVIDWLNGRAPGYTDSALTIPATPSWHDGNAGMIGKSYDGTLAQGVAATGVAGLKTIVPESAIDDWYAYSRMGGIRFNTHYPAGLSNLVTDTGRRAACAATRTTMSADDGDATGDRNVFWDARDYRPGLGNVTASVLAVHGLQDDNVRMDHFTSWWAGLKANAVPRKLWLLRAGHIDPFDLRRAEWVDTLHKWFDHWLYGIDNDVMDQPRVDLQDADKSWHTASDWPLPEAAPVDLYLRATDQAAAGDIGLASGGALDSVTWVDAPTQSETAMMNMPGTQANRRVFLSAPLKADLRISGTPVVNLRASLDKTQSNLGALLVDYGAGSQVTRNGDGATTVAGTRTCWGQDDDETTGDFSACYLEINQPTVAVTQWRVTKGILDSSNRSSLSVPSLVTTATPTDFPITMVPQDHVFAAGHQIGVILVGDYRDFASVAGTPGTTFTMDTRASTVSLPVVGGPAAAAASGGFDTTTPVLTVPADITAAATSAAGATVSWPAPTVTDDQDPSPSVTCTPASGSAFGVGTTTVTCTASDASGNATTGTFAVTVTAFPVVDPPASDGGGTTTGGTTPAPVTPAPSTPTGPAPPPAAQPATLDRIPLRLTALTLSGRHRQALLTFKLSVKATVTVTIKRHGAKRTTKTITARLAPGTRTIRAKNLRAGRYALAIKARDATGATVTLRRTLTVRAS
jgi:X-Pro dipeptidyl-peptidase